MKNSAVLLVGRGGLGDAIYARPFVRELARQWSRVFVSTSWPAVFHDLPAHAVPRPNGLALQMHHAARVPSSTWASPPAAWRRVSVRYRWAQLAARKSVLAAMEARSGIQPRPLVMDLPPLPPSPVGGRYAVIRPPTNRLDYSAPAREPMSEYLVAAAVTLREQGYHVVTVGAMVPGLEEPVATIPADRRYEHGELQLLEAIALVANAAIVVSGPSWIVPACTASRTPLVVIAGGIGGRNAPEALVDRRLDARHVRWLLPDRYCRCSDRGHACPREIANCAERFAELLYAATARAA